MPAQTLYQYTTLQMKSIVSMLLQLADETQNFTHPLSKHWTDEIASTMLLNGKGIDILPEESARANIWFARAAIPFDLEKASTGILYQKILPYARQLIIDTVSETDNFSNITPDWIHKNPQVLPVLMHVLGSFSKQNLKVLIGSVNDNSISKPASIKLAEYLKPISDNKSVPSPEHINIRLKSTIEGIVRDLVGSLLLENFVATALRQAKVPFLHEKEYPSLQGVIYNFRADFVIPDHLHPKAFIEVRKSSTRHASLYAKDKMFSAINWKGLHQDCLAILVIDGPWSAASLEVMAKVFDYVIPVAMMEEMSKKIREYLDGNDDIIRWLIHFKVEPFKKAQTDQI